MKKYILLSIFMILLSCNNESTEQETVSDETANQVKEEEQLWRGVISLNDSTDLPFNFIMETGEKAYSITILNGDERITTTDIEQKNDSLTIHLPVFANFFQVEFKDGRMEGHYINPDAEDYRLPFKATANDSTRFKANEKKCCDINEKWAVQFNPATANPKPAIAYFEQKGNKVTGTFMTETGDYRFLEGVLSGNDLFLSAFDGAHLVVFTANLQGGQKMEGHYYSGRSYMAPWIAYRDDNFELRDPKELTYLKDNKESLTFELPDLNGNMVSISDEKYKDKAVIIQIMGSWCPNCMDESRYLKQIYEHYNDEGLEIIALTFERAANKNDAIKRAAKMKNDLELPYPVLMAGYTRDDKASEVLPQLNHIMSYPTTIYLNRDHEVVDIHTGFNGPGTPIYDKYVSENQILIEKLVLPASESVKP